MAERMRVTSFIAEVAQPTVPARARAPSLESPRGPFQGRGSVPLEFNRLAGEGIDVRPPRFSLLSTHSLQPHGQGYASKLSPDRDRRRTITAAPRRSKSQGRTSEVSGRCRPRDPDHPGSPGVEA